MKNAGEINQLILMSSKMFQPEGFVLNKGVGGQQKSYVQLSKKKKELEQLDERLGKLVSKEMRDQLELEAITKMLTD